MDLFQFYHELHPQSDKGTLHSYIFEYYNNLFTPLKDSKFNLLEIGIQEGYSMDLWRGWFTQAILFGIDLSFNETVDRVNNTFKNSKAFLRDGFVAETVSLFDNDSFDFIIEDGPHTVETQVFAAQEWSKKLKTNGLLIIEDIQNPDKDCETIIDSIKDRPELSIKVIDLRSRKNRYDDVIVEITRVS